MVLLMAMVHGSATMDDMRPCRLHIMGASGSGTTTLGRAVADAWAVPHADTDDYFWIASSPPYTTKRPVDERLSLMEQVFLPRPAWVLSGALTGWGQPVIERCEAVVFLALDPEERMLRLEARESVRHGAAHLEGRTWREFRTWARGYDLADFPGRNRKAHEEWLARIPQPVLRLDSAQPLEQLRDAVLAWEAPG